MDGLRIFVGLLPHYGKPITRIRLYLANIIHHDSNYHTFVVLQPVLVMTAAPHEVQAQNNILLSNQFRDYRL